MHKILLIASVWFLILSEHGIAQDVVAEDDAGDLAYADGWQPGDNGGFGFEPWQFEHFFDAAFSPYDDAHFIAENTFVDTPSGGPAFGHTNGNRVSWGYTSWSIRAFSSPLEDGQTFAVDLDNPVLAPLSKFDPSGVLIRFRDSDDLEKLTLLAQAGFNTANWTLFDAGPVGIDTSLSASATANGGFNFGITMMDATAYELTLTPLSDGAPVMITGDLRNPGLPISQVELVMYSNGSAEDGSREFYANNLRITQTAAGRNFIWDGLGDGDWSGSRWSVPDQVPSTVDNATIIDNRVFVRGHQSAAATNVESGELRIAGQLDSPMTIAADGAVSGTGTVVGDVFVDGQFVITEASALDIVGDLRLSHATLEVNGEHAFAAGANTGMFNLVTAESVSGEFQLVPDAYLGSGIFLDAVEYVSDAIRVDLYVALSGDANRDGHVDVSDFNIWHDHRGVQSANWLVGDFNDDGNVNELDFDIWNVNKFTSASATASVPEPPNSVSCLLVFFAAFAFRGRVMA